MIDEYYGLKCPACGQTDGFEVLATTVRLVRIDGNSDCLDDPGGDVEWDDTSAMSCCRCQHEGIVSDFSPKEHS